jgi:glycosyltransferase involved in cell wall biosynthesis
MARPRLLFLSQILPFPADSGVAIRTFNVLRLLSERYDVTALCFYRRRAHASIDAVQRGIEALRAHARVEAFPIDQEHSRWRFVTDHLRSVATGTAYTRFVYESRDFRTRLQEILRDGQFDLVHLDSLDLSGYIPLVDHLPIVCVHHNVESKLLRRRAAGERSPLRGWYSRLQARFTEREERRWCPRVQLNVMVSEGDLADLRSLVGAGSYTVVPNGVDIEEYQPGPGGGQSLVYLGGTEWFPNTDALEFFGEEILPRIRAAGENPSVYWVGRASREEQRRYRERLGVELTGYVDDIRPWVHGAACAIVPLRIGGGTRLKITTAWALGKAIVSTSIGCEGLDARDGENLLVRDTPDSIADAIVSLLRDEALRRRLERGARETAEQIYSWRVIGRSMLRDYEAVLGPPSPAGLAPV